MTPNLPRFSIYRCLHSQPKRIREARALAPFLLALEAILRLDDVEYGQDPPDFVFHYHSTTIGVEFTKLPPTLFKKDGYTRIKDFANWKAQIGEFPSSRQEFLWGEFTLRESLTAFANCVETKTKKAEKWHKKFIEKWLIVTLDEGGPFGTLVCTRSRNVPGREQRVADYAAKMAYEVSAICHKQHHFDCIILFSGMVFDAFPTGNKNPYSLPILRPEVLERGKNAPDTFLEWRSTMKSVVQPMPEDYSATETGESR